MDISLHPLAYLYDWFNELYLPGGYGFGPFALEYREIEAYSDALGLDMRPFERRTVRQISEAYAGTWHAKEAKKNSTPDGMTEVSADDHQGIKALFSKAGKGKS